MTTELRTVSSVALVLKEGNQPAEELGRTVEGWLRARGATVHVVPHGGTERCCKDLPHVDLLLAFGGDGTMVSIARQLMGRNIPIAGVNFGRVGFLAELSRDTWEKSLENVLANGVHVEPRMALQYRLYRNGSVLYSGEVVNDVVVTRGKVARLVRLTLGVNDEPFVVLRSDGLILSTPTGSSGYAGSAGGPLLLPTLNSYVVAAICPYLSSFPPLVLDAATTFSVTVDGTGADLYLTLDGQEAHALTGGDCLEVVGVPARLHMADLGVTGYFERLRIAGFVQESKTRQEWPL